VAFIAGTYLSYHIMAYFMLIFPILFFASFIFLPYMPQDLTEYNRSTNQAEQALNLYSKLGTDLFYDELDRLKIKFVDENGNKYKNNKSNQIELSELGTVLLNNTNKSY